MLLRGSVLRRIIGLALLTAAPPLFPATTTGFMQEIRGLTLDSQQCYRVRDVFLEREDVKLYFTDGYLIFAEPLEDRTIAALFISTRFDDIGEVLLIPPTPAERQSMMRFVGETILNEKFRNAMMFFTDDTGEVLKKAIDNSPGSSLDVQQGERLASRWSSVMRNIMQGSTPRIFLDLYSGRGQDQGFFAAAIRGSKLTRFNIVVDPMLPDQVVAGQIVRSGNRSYYEIWSRFEGRSYREGNKRTLPFSSSLENYKIDTKILPDLGMEVQFEATVVQSAVVKAIGFEISESLDVTAVRIAGSDVEYLQYKLPSMKYAQGQASSLVVVIVPEIQQDADRYLIEFDYEGRVISDAGSGVYFVDNRESWYPRSGNERTNYDLTFSYPSGLELVATGRRVEDTTEEGMRRSRFQTSEPIRLAGFNLGDYASTNREVDGYSVEVRATKSLERRLQTEARTVVLPNRAVSPGRRNERTSRVLTFPAPPSTSPARNIERIADDSAAAFHFFLDRFGEPAMPVTTISPVPENFGQGFPGLVYTSTLSYFSSGDEPLKKLDSSDRRFYSELMRPHEIAHQWWGNVVSAKRDQDVWLMEALATYSSLLWLEEQHGKQELRSVLGEYQQNLLEKSVGSTMESAGPVILGRRLRTSRLPSAYRVIVYQKGAWILHMLRGILGDANFLELLSKLCEEYRHETVSTEEFRALAAGYTPEGYHDSDLQDFFDQWVYDSGIPRLSMEWKQSSKGGRHTLKVQVEQDGVSEFFAIQVPVQVHTLPGRSLVKTVLTGHDDEDTGFTVVLRNPASRVVLDPEHSLLAIKQ